VDFFNDDNEPGLFSLNITEYQNLMFNYSIAQAPVLNSKDNTCQLSLNLEVTTEEDIAL